MVEETTSDQPAWLKCTVTAEAAVLELLALLLIDLGSGGIEEDGGSIAAWFAPARKSEVEEALDLFRKGQKAQLGWAWSEVAKEDWWESWKKYFHPFRASERLWVRPSWEEQPPPDPSMAVLVVDPGRAFGTGSHETTRLCLKLIDEALAAKPAASIFDVGSGSGILTVAARLLGVQKALAIDIDPLAVSATLENARMNGVAEGVLTARADVRAVAARHPLVVCNILYQIIMGIAPELVRKVEPGGTLILSGFLVNEAEGVERMFKTLGLDVCKREEMGQWGALVFEAPL